MNEFLPRPDLAVPATGANERSIPIVRSVQAARSVGKRTDSEARADPHVTERSAETESYARIQANIAKVLNGLREPGGQTKEAVSAGNQALMDLLPQPVVMLPMPPTDPKMIAFVAQVAQALAQQAANARAAQAHVSPAVVDALGR